MYHLLIQLFVSICSVHVGFWNCRYPCWLFYSDFVKIICLMGHKKLGTSGFWRSNHINIRHENLITKQWSTFNISISNWLQKTPFSVWTCRIQRWSGIALNHWWLDSCLWVGVPFHLYGVKLKGSSHALAS